VAGGKCLLSIALAGELAGKPVKDRFERFQEAKSRVTSNLGR
jgi:hypothetical protein